MYNFLLKRGVAPFLCYWSDDIILSSPKCISAAISRLRQNKLLGAAIFANKRDGENVKFAINMCGIPSINYGIIKREAFKKVNGLSEIYSFFCADNDFTNKICFKAQYKLYLMPLDFYVLSNSTEYKNPYGDPKGVMYVIDQILFKRKWADYLRIADIPPRKEFMLIN